MTDKSETTNETNASKPAKELLVVRDEGFFTHSTGDTYEGGFEIKKKDLLPKMIGHGVYTTAEGDLYRGTWDYDKLGVNEEINITFADRAKYDGLLKDWCYSGSGTYTYPDESVLSGHFSENCPTGSLTLSDPNGQTWLGTADHGFGWFEPVNHFYTLLQKRDNPKMKHHRRRHKNPEAHNM